MGGNGLSRSQISECGTWGGSLPRRKSSVRGAIFVTESGMGASEISRGIELLENNRTGGRKNSKHAEKGNLRFPKSGNAFGGFSRFARLWMLTKGEFALN